MQCELWRLRFERHLYHGYYQLNLFWNKDVILQHSRSWCVFVCATHLFAAPRFSFFNGSLWRCIVSMTASVLSKTKQTICGSVNDMEEFWFLFFTRGQSIVYTLQCFYITPAFSHFPLQLNNSKINVFADIWETTIVFSAVAARCVSSVV